MPPLPILFIFCVLLTSGLIIVVDICLVLVVDWGKAIELIII